MGSRIRCKMKKISILLTAILMVLVLASCQGGQYKKAMAHYDAGEYEKAIELFTKLGDYENSAEMLKDSKYLLAIKYYEAKDFENAKALFDELSDYKDSPEQLKNTKRAIMFEEYKDVVSSIKKRFWYCNGGSDTTLGKLSFKGENAIIEKVYFDGNGKHNGDTDTYTYSIDEKYITLMKGDSKWKDISYKISNGAVVLDETEFFTTSDINKGLQGYWSLYDSEYVFGVNLKNKYTVYINEGTIMGEQAARLINGNGVNYQGPYEGEYTLNFGGFNSNMKMAYYLFFNIIDGKVTLLNYNKKYHPIQADRLPGRYGYSF